MQRDGREEGDGIEAAQVGAPVRRTLGKADLPGEIEAIATRIIGCAFAVHTGLGCGLLERVYEQALIHELSLAGIRSRGQVEVTIPYKGTSLIGQRLDLLVENVIVVELKSIAKVLEVHRAQTLSYLRAAGLPLGLIFNFGVPHLRNDMHRVLNARSPLLLRARDSGTSSAHSAASDSIPSYSSLPSR